MDKCRPINLQTCNDWDASKTEKDVCLGTPNSPKGKQNATIPEVIGDQQIDFESDLWKDEDKSLIYENER